MSNLNIVFIKKLSLSFDKYERDAMTDDVFNFSGWRSLKQFEIQMGYNPIK